MRMSLSSPAKTKKAYEIHFGINHVTQAMLAQLLLPKLLDPKRAGPTADVRMHVTASMAANIFGPKNGLNLEYMNEANPGSSVPFRYGHFKLAALFFAQSLAERYPSIVTMAAHSGAARVSLGTKSPLHDSQRSGRLRDICFGRSKGGLPSTKSTGL